MSLALGNDGIFVRYSDYKYIFFSETDSKYEIRRQTEDGFAYVRNVLGHIPQINQMRFVAGTVLRAAGRTEPATLLARRIALCGMWENSAMDCVIFPQEDDEGWTPRKADPLKDLSQISGESRPQRHVSELDAAFKCTAAMLSAPSLESSVRGVLRHIG